jgi:hypothetical protein
VAIDAINGFVHVVYSLRSSQGAGVFYAHQMDPRAGFEQPIAIVYGERAGAARVSSDDSVVAVAYEDPNGGTRSGISLAVSTTSGHSFGERLVASSTSGGSRDPYVVVKGKAIVVGWSDISGDNIAPKLRIRRARLR